MLSRKAKAIGHGIRCIRWDGETLGEWARELEESLAVINLAGRSVNCRYNENNKRDIDESRLRSTRTVGEAIAACRTPPAVWLNSSSATIYRHALDHPMDEATGEIGHGFSVDVCRRWEKALNDAEAPRTRRVALRSAMVFGPGEGGVFEAFHNIVRCGLGGTLGRGDQFVSWIHIEDFARAVQWIVEHEALAGPVNVSSPNPVPNRDFMRIFRESSHRRIGLPASTWMLKIGAFLLQTETELLLKSRRVVPGKLLNSGFQFRYPTWREALQNIIVRALPRD